MLFFKLLLRKSERIDLFLGSQFIPRQLLEGSEATAANSPVSGLITFSGPAQTPPGQMRYPLRSTRRIHSAKSGGANSNSFMTACGINVAGGRPDIDCSLIGDEPPCKKFRSG